MLAEAVPTRKLKISGRGVPVVLIYVKGGKCAEIEWERDLFPFSRLNSLWEAEERSRENRQHTIGQFPPLPGRLNPPPDQ
jgi:hypothetical protein